MMASGGASVAKSSSVAKKSTLGFIKNGLETKPAKVLGVLSDETHENLSH